MECADQRAAERKARRYGGAVRRLGAAAIDYLIIVVLSTLLFLGILKGVEWAGVRVTVALITNGYMSMATLFGVIYFTLFEGGTAQATWGKKLLKIQVAGLTGASVSYGRALGRTVFKIIFVLGFAGLGIVSMFFTAKQQTIYDLLLQTTVIDSKDAAGGKGYI